MYDIWRIIPERVHSRSTHIAGHTDRDRAQVDCRKRASSLGAVRHRFPYNLCLRGWFNVGVDYTVPRFALAIGVPTRRFSVRRFAQLTRSIVNIRDGNVRNWHAE